MALSAPIILNDCIGYIAPRYYGYYRAITSDMFAFYPCGNHWGQFVLLQKASSWSIIWTENPDPEVTRWRIYTSGANRQLDVLFYGVDYDVKQAHGFPTWQAAAATYKAWAEQQSWYVSRKQQRATSLVLPLTFSIATGSVTNMLAAANTFNPKPYFWSTIYRDSLSVSDPNGFDKYYPNYKVSTAFIAELERINTAGVGFVPYINGALVDTTPSRIAFTGYDAAMSLRNQALATVQYSGTLPHLEWVCPHHPDWPNRIYSGPAGNNGWDSIRDTSNRKPSGIYLDVLTNAYPQLCYSTSHGHAPGDPKSWVIGVKNVLQRFSEASFISAEGFAEPYIPYMDAAYVYAPQVNDFANRPAFESFVPLAQFIYGSVIDISGYKIANRTPGGPLTITPAQALDRLQRAYEIGSWSWDDDQGMAELFTQPAWANLAAATQQRNALRNIVAAPKRTRIDRRKTLSSISGLENSVSPSRVIFRFVGTSGKDNSNAGESARLAAVTVADGELSSSSALRIKTLWNTSQNSTINKILRVKLNGDTIRTLTWGPTSGGGGTFPDEFDLYQDGSNIILVSQTATNAPIQSVQGQLSRANEFSVTAQWETAGAGTETVQLKMMEVFAI